MMAGQYNEIIKIYKSIETINDYGEREITTQLDYTTRAKVEETSGSRQNENNEIVYDHLKTFYTRSYIQITDTDIIEFDGRKWRVISIDRRKEYNDIKIATELINE